MSRAPLYFITSDDEHLLRRAMDRVVKGLQQADPDIEIDWLDAGEVKELPDLRTANLFGGGRCIVLRRLEKVTAGLKGELEDYCENPDPDATVVMLTREPGKTMKIGKLAEAAGERLDVKAPAPWDAAGWNELIRQEFEIAGRAADKAAYGAILEHAGHDPGVIASKVDQVAQSTAPGHKITIEDVEKVVEGHGSRGAFAVADAVERRDATQAIIELRGALEAGHAPLAIMGMLNTRFRQLLGARGGQSARDMGVSTGRHRMLKGASAKFTPGELAWCHDMLAQTDLDLKGSDLPNHLIIEVAVMELATSRSVGRPWNPLA